MGRKKKLPKRNKTQKKAFLLGRKWFGEQWKQARVRKRDMDLTITDVENARLRADDQCRARFKPNPNTVNNLDCEIVDDYVRRANKDIDNCQKGSLDASQEPFRRIFQAERKGKVAKFRR